MRDDAMDLIAASARKLVDQLAFARVAFGAASGVAMFDCAELERLTRGVFAHVRAELDWAVTRAVAAESPRPVLVNLAQLAAGALPLGGTARLELTQDGEGYLITAVARGPKARLHAEVAGGPRRRAARRRPRRPLGAGLLRACAGRRGGRTARSRTADDRGRDAQRAPAGVNLTPQLTAAPYRSLTNAGRERALL